ncbi:MAG: hypothetical protein KF823_01490 [Xanthomonadales bacterium]|nr:hypothetical protein [Xanthomonadales bacterium]
MNRLSPPLPGNRLSRWLAGAAAVFGLAVSAVLGAFVFLALLGLALVAMLVIAARLALLRRRLRRSSGAAPGRTPGGVVADAEYVVVERHTRY